jgi:hypothetical protein
LSRKTTEFDKISGDVDGRKLAHTIGHETVSGSNGFSHS